MSSHRPTIWMNVTTSANWNRPPVGIVRVEQALCSELEKLIGQQGFKQCIWSNNRFQEWRPDTAQGLSVHSEKSAPDPVRKQPSLRSLLKRLSRFAELLFQNRQRCECIQPELDQSYFEVPPTLESPFVAGDVLISVGLDWDQSYTRTFFSLRKERQIKVITCCYDLIPVLFPQYCVGDVASRFTEYFFDVARGSDAILCISKQSEHDLKWMLEKNGAAEPRTCVIRLGDNVPEGTGEISSEILELVRKPFVLFVSTIERRKNHEVLYRAYHRLCQEGHRDSLPRLIFVGMPGWGVGDFLKDLDLDPLIQGLVLQLNNVSDAELRYLYDEALFCLYPSLYEGWGLPVGEALALGKVVLSSDRGSLPEVGGNLVRYLDPWDARAWADAILETSSNDELRLSISARVRETYQASTWGHTAAIVKSLIDDLLDIPLKLELFPGYDLSTLSGEHAGPLIRSCGRPGTLMFGPHRSFNAGVYRITLWDVAHERLIGRAKLDVVSNLGHVVHWKHELDIDASTDSKHTPLLDFWLELEAPTENLEVRCEILSGALTLSKLTIEERKFGQVRSRLPSTQEAIA